MRRYKRYKKFKPCPNNGVRCGKSSRCWPAGTKCKSSRDIRKDNVKRRKDKKIESDVKDRAENKIPLAAILGVVGVSAIAVGGLAYVMTKQGTMIPEAAEKSIDVDKNLPDNFQRYDQKIDRYRGATPEQEVDLKSNQRRAQNWANEVINDKDTVFLDLETTSTFEGVDPYDSSTWKKYRKDVPGIWQIGIVDSNLKEAWDIRLDPGKKIDKRAQDIGGLSDDDIKRMENKPSFKEYYPYLKEKLEGKRVIAFNSRFDLQVIDALCHKHDLPLIKYKNRLESTANKDGIVQYPPLNNDADAMYWFALYKGKRTVPKFVDGEYSSKESIAYTKLPTIPGGKAHDAFTDVLSTYDVLRYMAKGLKPRGMSPSEEKRWKEFNRD